MCINPDFRKRKARILISLAPSMPILLVGDHLLEAHFLALLAIFLPCSSALGWKWHPTILPSLLTPLNSAHTFAKICHLNFLESPLLIVSSIFCHQNPGWQSSEKCQRWDWSSILPTPFESPYHYALVKSLTTSFFKDWIASINLLDVFLPKYFYLLLIFALKGTYSLF